MLVLLIGGCSSEPAYKQVLAAEEAKTNAIDDRDERNIRTSAQLTYMSEAGARPFEVVLAEERARHQAMVEEVHAEFERKQKLNEDLDEAKQSLKETTDRIEARRKDRLWKQQSILVRLKPGDIYPSISEIGISERTIRREDGRRVEVFERKQETGVNTLVTVGSDGVIERVDRF